MLRSGIVEGVVAMPSHAVWHTSANVTVNFCVLAEGHFGYLSVMATTCGSVGADPSSVNLW